MRRRLILAIAGTAAASVLLFALPLAFAIRQSCQDAEILRLQRDAMAATRQMDLSSTLSDTIELPTSSGAIDVYAPDGSQRVGQGPVNADYVVQQALASGRPTDTSVDGRLAAAVPLVVREHLAGVVRFSRDAEAPAAPVRRA